MAVSTSCGTASRPIMSPPVRLSKLPPISSCHEGDEAPSTHPSKLLLESATSELKDTMKHLLSEAQSAEDRLQQAIDSLWQRMMEMIEKRTQDYDIQLSKTSDELKIVKGQLAKTTEQEAALVQQNAKMSVELVAGDKKQKLLESDLQSAKDQLKKREAEICKLREETRKLQTRHDGVAENLGKELEEKNKTLKDYQDKITKMTDKLQKLTRNLTEEKAATEKLQKANGSQIAQQTSDNRKMALEISKLKLQVTTTSTALAASKEEVKQLEMQLKKANTESEATVSSLQRQHVLAVKSLEDKITALQLEIDELKAKHEAEIALLKEQLENLAAEGDDGFLDARIRFLQHQNRQEKIKIHKEKKKQS